MANVPPFIFQSVTVLLFCCLNDCAESSNGTINYPLCDEYVESHGKYIYIYIPIYIHTIYTYTHAYILYQLQSHQSRYVRTYRIPFSNHNAAIPPKAIKQHTQYTKNNGEYRNARSITLSTPNMLIIITRTPSARLIDWTAMVKFRWSLRMKERQM